MTIFDPKAAIEAQRLKAVTRANFCARQERRWAFFVWLPALALLYLIPTTALNARDGLWRLLPGNVMGIATGVILIALCVQMRKRWAEWRAEEEESAARLVKMAELVDGLFTAVPHKNASGEALH
jgi:hypothetical protein